jgi:RNA polymerase sigma-70 factor, ECF subfamily
VEKYSDFYKQNKDKLFGYLVRLTGDYGLASDILQESFTRLLASYGPNEQNTGLLFRIARNAVLDVKRKDRWSRDVDEHDLKDETNPENQFIILEAYRRVLDAMERLDDTERDVLSMAVSSGFSYREISEVVGISEGHVRVKIHRARAKLKDILKRGGEEDL